MRRRKCNLENGLKRGYYKKIIAARGDSIFNKVVGNISKKEVFEKKGV